MENVSLTGVAEQVGTLSSRFAMLEAHIEQRFSSMERLQQWTLGTLVTQAGILLAGAFAIIATLLK